MPQLVLQLHPCDTHDVCACCGERAAEAADAHLARADTMELVCRACGNKHDPSLVALLDLAQVAQRVGRIARHHVSPPMTALLDLARAAENYTNASGALQGCR